MLILSLETSCDETAAAVVCDGRKVLSNAVYTQISIHAEYGGVVPELASRKHVEKLCAVTDSALSQAGVQRSDIDAVAVTAAPGLIGALLTGLSFASKPSTVSITYFSNAQPLSASISGGSFPASFNS